MRRVLCAVLLAASATVALPVCAQKKPVKPKPKPAATKPKPTQNKPPYTLGTQQMSGSEVVMGKEYTLGKASPMNISMTKVEYRGDRVRLGNDYCMPLAAEKLVVCTFTLHNPQSQEVLARFDTFRFTVVDEKGANTEYIKEIARPETGETFSISLKPGQKLAAYVVIPMAADADIEKLMVISSDDQVLRYPLKGKLAPLAAAFADPSEPKGFKAKTEYTAKVGEVFQIPARDQSCREALSLAVEGASLYTGTKGGEPAPEDYKFVVLNMRLRNEGHEKCELVRWDSWGALLRFDDGTSSEEKLMMHPTSDRETEYSPEKGSEVKFRYIYTIPKDVKLKSVTFTGAVPGGRAITIDLSGITL